MRALSPIVSVVILVIAAIIGGTLVYQYFLTTMAALIAKPNIVIDEAFLYTSLNRLYVKVSNLGTTPVKVVGVNFYCGEASVFREVTPTLLKPGDSVSLEVTLPVETVECKTMYVSLRFEAPNYGNGSTRPVEPLVMG